MKVAVDTMSLPEISELFRASMKDLWPKAKPKIQNKLKALKKAGVTKHKWVERFEYAGTKVNFYLEQAPKDDVFIQSGMIHRRKEGLILVTPDISNGGMTDVLAYKMFGPTKWEWMNIYTGHFCTRYAERILKVTNPTFEAGSEALMLSDIGGPIKVVDTINEAIEEIEFSFPAGLSFGYRDLKSKIIYFRTVISKEMEKGNQVGFRDETKEALEALYELFKHE